MRDCKRSFPAATHSGKLLIQRGGPDRYLADMTDQPQRPAPTDDEDSAESDLARRLARYRRRVEAEGRPRSVKFIDRAIEDAGKPDERR